MKTRTLLLLLACAAMSWPACSFIVDTDGVCTAPADCPAGHACVAGRCRAVDGGVVDAGGAPGTGGSVGTGGGTTSPSCSAANCTGCCAGDTCVHPDGGLSPWLAGFAFHCGTSAQVCAMCDPVRANGCTARGVCACFDGRGNHTVCQPDQECQQGQCVCTPASCAGACAPDGSCVSTPTDTCCFPRQSPTAPTCDDCSASDRGKCNLGSCTCAVGLNYCGSACRSPLGRACAVADQCCSGTCGPSSNLTGALACCRAEGTACVSAADCCAHSSSNTADVTLTPALCCNRVCRAPGTPGCP